MSYPSDAEIAQAASKQPIAEIAQKLGIDEAHIERYGDDKAKVNDRAMADSAQQKESKLILVTAMSPTPAGEGKTTTVVGLGDALQRIGKNAAVAIREPSLGPVFGLKGGAAGGGYAQVVPMEDINLHFTGDFHAIGAANNLLAAIVDNHIHQGNELNIDPRKITWQRAVDMNDRQLRHIVGGLQGKANGTPREDSFEITVASEVMAVLCLAQSIEDLKERLRKIIIGYTPDDEPVTAGQLQAHGAMAALLKEAIKPNLVQTLEHTPAFVHGGPFANIAHGCNSVKATKLALNHADYVVTEAGFGADLGAEKFMDIKCRQSGLNPAAVVVVATIRALKMHGGVSKNNLDEENVTAVENGLPNLLKHLENVTEGFGMRAVVALNQFPTDSEAELNLVKEKCRTLGVDVALSDVWAEGGAGGEALAESVVNIADQERRITYTYELEDSITEKIDKLVRKIYGGEGFTCTRAAEKEIAQLKSAGFGHLPICMAKTQSSFSDDPTKVGRPHGFKITVRNVKVSAGAGFIVVLTGAIMTMPGLPKKPAAENMDIDANSHIYGLS